VITTADNALAFVLVNEYQISEIEVNIFVTLNKHCFQVPAAAK
jgi:hypothetical protein